MNVRLISGRFGGRIIDAPNNKRTHPMSERIRNAMFNKLIDELEGAEVLDAFAGSGAVGLEAVSRRAKSVIMLERDRLACKIIKKNIETIGADGADVVCASVLAWLNNNPEQMFDIIFADPPYHDTQFSTVKKLMEHLKPGGTMILSHPGRGELPTKTGVVVVDNRSYGNAVLTYYRREE